MNFNPVTTRELKERFRRGRSGLFVTLWIALVIGVGYLIYLTAGAWASSGGFFGRVSPMLISASLGRIMFEMVSLLLLTGVLLIVPGVASLSIVGERERLTLPLLQISQLKPTQIVFGKLGSSLAYLFLLLVAVAPIMLVPILFGGVDALDVMKAVAVIAVTAILIGSISVWVSARSKTTRGAVAGAYLCTFALVALTGLTLIGELMLFAPSDRDMWGSTGRELYSVWLNPYVALVSAVDEPLEDSNAFISIATPFNAVDSLLSHRQWGSRSELSLGGAVFGSDEMAIFEGAGRNETRADFNRGPLWVRSLLAALLLSVIALWRAARQVTVPGPVPRRRLRLRRKEPEHAVA